MQSLNLHPLFVHFPIALLTVYSVLELLRFKKLNNSNIFFGLKAVLVILGAISAVPTILSGKMIEPQFVDQANLVEFHSHVAIFAVLTYLIIAGTYVIRCVETYFLLPKSISYSLLFSKLLKLSKVTFFQVFFALLGFGLLGLTGILGGIIAFGPNMDPFTSFVWGIVKPLL